MSLTLGIVGLPNVGKSTLFNALTRNDVLAANYPFATIEPNVGVVPLPDPRLDKLAEIFALGARSCRQQCRSWTSPASSRARREGAGLGNKFLANIREADAICQVVRVFDDDDVVHVDGRVDPLADIETINTELILADLQTLEKAIPRLEKEARTHKDRGPVLDAAQGRGRFSTPGRRCSPPASNSTAELTRTEPAHHQAVPVRVQRRRVGAHRREPDARNCEKLVAPADAVFLDAKVESELLELDEESARGTAGVHRSSPSQD